MRANHNYQGDYSLHMYSKCKEHFDSHHIRADLDADQDDQHWIKSRAIIGPITALDKI